MGSSLPARCSCWRTTIRLRAGYAEIAGIHHSIGGEAAASAYVLARLGVATRLDGNWLGDDESSVRAIAILAAAGVDCSAITRENTTASVTEAVLTAGASRTVFGTYRKLLADRAWNDPSEEAIRTSRIICLDPFFPEASAQAARWCRAAGTPYVTVDTYPDSEIAHHAEVLIISGEFATRELGPSDPGEILAAYRSQCPGLVILTRGSEPLLYGRGQGEPQAFTPFSVNTRDTTGAGDGFRAGIMYAMLQGHDDDRLIRTGSAVAALVCQGFPGVLDGPGQPELADFARRP